MKKLPLSYVKLDGSYIRDLTENKDNQIFVESLSNMVKAFGMRTIAEFVEDKPTMDLLAKLNVDYAHIFSIEQLGLTKPEFENKIMTIP